MSRKPADFSLPISLLQVAGVLWCGGVALRLQSAAPKGVRRLEFSFRGVLTPPNPPRHGPSVTAAPGRPDVKFRKGRLKGRE